MPTGIPDEVKRYLMMASQGASPDPAAARQDYLSRPGVQSMGEAPPLPGAEVHEPEDRYQNEIDQAFLHDTERKLAKGEQLRGDHLALYEATRKKMSGQPTAAPASSPTPLEPSHTRHVVRTTEVDRSGGKPEDVAAGQVPMPGSVPQVNERSLAPQDKSGIPDNIAQYLKQFDQNASTAAGDRNDNSWKLFGASMAEAFNPKNNGMQRGALTKSLMDEDNILAKDQDQRFKIVQEGQKEKQNASKNELGLRGIMAKLDIANQNAAKADLTAEQKAYVDQARLDIQADIANQRYEQGAMRMKHLEDVLELSRRRAGTMDARADRGFEARSGNHDDDTIIKRVKMIPPQTLDMAHNLKDLDTTIKRMGGLAKMEGVGFVEGAAPTSAIGQQAQKFRQQAQAVLNVYTHALYGAALTKNEEENRDAAVAQIKGGKTVGQIANGLQILKYFVNKGIKQALLGARQDVKDTIMGDVWREDDGVDLFPKAPQQQGAGPTHEAAAPATAPGEFRVDPAAMDFYAAQADSSKGEALAFDPKKPDAPPKIIGPEEIKSFEANGWHIFRTGAM